MPVLDQSKIVDTNDKIKIDDENKINNVNIKEKVDTNQ